MSAEAAPLNLTLGTSLAPASTMQERVSSLPRSAVVAQTLILGLLFAVPASRALRYPCVTDPDIWWHLRTGDVILHTHAIPTVDMFSRAVAGHPWQAYSWLFDVLVSGLFHHFGMVGIVLYTAFMLLAVTAALYRLIARTQADFSIAVLLTFAAGFSMIPLETPRPWLFTILFFMVELDILQRVRASGKVRHLAWLPLVFTLWANIHIQFIDGFIVLGIALADALLTRRLTGSSTGWKARPLAYIFGLCLAATLLNPYGWHIYQAAYDLSTQAGVLNKIGELQAMPFRDLCNFLVLALGIGSAIVLARRKGLAVFETLLLLFAFLVSFRSQRDVWVMVATAAVILGNATLTKQSEKRHLPAFAYALAGVLAIAGTLLGLRVFHTNTPHLEEVRAKALPVEAAAFVKAHHLPGPLYNDFNWGGYLLWDLQMPVAIDGRAALYGDKIIDRSVATWGGQPDWASDPQLTSANLVIGPVTSPLTQLLRTDARYHLAFEDKVAAVFTSKLAK